MIGLLQSGERKDRFPDGEEIPLKTASLETMFESVSVLFVCIVL